MNEVNGASDHSAMTLRPQEIFRAADTLKMDITACGMRLQEAAGHFRLSLLSFSGQGFRLRSGTESRQLEKAAAMGDRLIPVGSGCGFSLGQEVWIYDLDLDALQRARVEALHPEGFLIAEQLREDFFAKSVVVGIREIEYRHFPLRRMLMRRVDRGPFHSLLADVGDFSLKHFPLSHSLLYGIRTGRGESVRGLVHLVNAM